VTWTRARASVTLRALVPNPERVLLPGMFVREVIQKVREGAVLAPQQGVSHDPKGHPARLVWLRTIRWQSRALKTDRAIGGPVLVTSGLKAGTASLRGYPVRQAGREGCPRRVPAARREDR